MATLIIASILEYVDYYKYLLKISWPALCGLFIIWTFLVIKSYVAMKTGLSKRNTTGIVKGIMRLAISLIVIIIYTDVFLRHYGDWMQKPGVLRGSVVSVIAKTPTQEDQYPLTIQTGEENVTVLVDKNTVEKLVANDKIEVAFLPIKKYAFRCTVLTQQAKSDI